MKKLIILVILLLSGCSSRSILNTVYISSIGIEYIDNEYIGYFYAPPTKDISKDQSTDDESIVFTIKDGELVNIFNKIYSISPTNVNLMHLKTMILSNTFTDYDGLLNYFKYSTKVSYNFHVLSTDESLDEVYSYKNESNISNLYNIFNSPSLIDYKSAGVSKCHFIKFANDYTNKYRYNHIPYIKIVNNAEEFDLQVSGYTSNSTIYDSDTFIGIDLLTNTNKEISHNNNVILLYDYKLKYEIIDNVYNFNISFIKKDVTGIVDIKDYIVSNLEVYLDTLIQEEGSLYMVNQYNYLYNKNVNNDTYKINITIK